MKATGVVRRIDDLGRCRYTKRNKKNTSNKRRRATVNTYGIYKKFI